MDLVRNYLLDLFFPRYCLGCEKLLTDMSANYLCLNCQTKIPFKTSFNCAFCSAPVALGQTCPFCIKEFQLDGLWVATSYETPLVEKIIKTLKYRLVQSLSNNIAVLLINYLQNQILPKITFSPPPLVTSVPLHPRRWNWRGFNQSELIAQAVGQHFNWPIDNKLLIRNKNKTPQAEITNRAERLTNMIGVFQCQSLDLKEKTILLVDDISTTGATLNDCARALKSAGAKEVVGLVFARNR